MHQAMRGEACQGAVVIGRARQHRDGHAAREIQPSAPSRQLLQDVGAHQPDESRTWVAPQQMAKRVCRIMCVESGLDRGGDDSAAIGNTAGGGQTLPEWCHAAERLQRIARGHKKPNLVEPQAPPGDINHVTMAGMRRVE